jgi:hypothetical protein
MYICHNVANNELEGSAQKIEYVPGGREDNHENRIWESGVPTETEPETALLARLCRSVDKGEERICRMKVPLVSNPPLVKWRAASLAITS